MLEIDSKSSDTFRDKKLLEKAETTQDFKTFDVLDQSNETEISEEHGYF